MRSRSRRRAGSPAITFEWYRAFLQTLLDNDADSWFAPLIVFGEIAVGIGLIFGCLTGFAAFFGALMNMSFLLAGSASTNPVLFTLAIGLSSPGRSPATTASTATCSRCSARPGIPERSRVERRSRSVAPKPPKRPRVPSPLERKPPPPGRQTRGRSIQVAEDGLLIAPAVRSLHPVDAIHR